MLTIVTGICLFFLAFSQAGALSSDPTSGRIAIDVDSEGAAGVISLSQQAAKINPKKKGAAK